MLVSLNRKLVFLLVFVTSLAVLCEPFGRNQVITFVDAASEAQSLSANPMQESSNYPFPFMRGLLTKAEDNSTSNDVSPTAVVPNSNASNSQINWTIVSGTWQSTANGVRAGGSSDVPGYAVRPLSTTSPGVNIDTSFTISSLPPNTASYVFVVYSWIDSQNYKYAGITLYDNNTYVYLNTVRDGIISAYPAWPGSITDSYVNLGEPVEMTLSLQSNSETLNINGAEVLENTSVEDWRGYVGLGYSRVIDILFHQFNVRGN